MKQLFMRKKPLGHATLTSEEVPVPKCGKNSLLLSNGYSIISAGTETMAVRSNMKDMVVKAMTEPDIRESVKEMLLKDGVMKTADRVHYETTKWTPMGYSGAGVAVEVGAGINDITEGDPVAYGGQGHAEIIRAAKNLSVKIPEGVSAKEASFVALGGIAMQGVRQAGVQLGETAAVIGLGLVGQLVSQMLVASGVRVIGSDPIQKRMDIALSLGMEKGFAPSEQIAKEIVRYTNHLGVDHVVICASASSNKIIEQAVEMARDRGRITMVGAVNMDIPREQFYMKELEFVISRSYGPGRYDPLYEEKGIDYPIGYVRWTEKRNMEEFLRLIQQGSLQIEPLVSHEFELKDAAEAYDLLIKKPDDCLAILLKYSTEPEEIKRTVSIKPGKKVHKQSDRSSVAIVGCGAFARQFHLPNIKANKHLDIRTLCASSGQSAKEMGERYGAEICTTDTDEIIEDPAVDSVMIFTRDTLHAGVVTAALKSGKHVFCEKPLATTLEECKGIMAAQKEKESVCFIGFNRRFAPLMQQAKKIVEKCDGPKMIHYRVNAGPLPNNSWIYDPAYSAGRVIGEICHFIDLMSWLVGKEPVSVIAQTAGSPKETVRTENVNALFRFEDGSTGSILYTAEGVSSFPKERMEIFSSGTAIAMDDYQRLTVRGAERIDETNRNGDKGHGEEIIRFTEAVLGRETPAISHIDGIRATICCLKILESIKDNEMKLINIPEILK